MADSNNNNKLKETELFPEESHRICSSRVGLACSLQPPLSTLSLVTATTVKGCLPPIQLCHATIVQQSIVVILFNHPLLHIYVNTVTGVATLDEYLRRGSIPVFQIIY